MSNVYTINDSFGDGVVSEVQTHLANGIPTIQIIGTVGKSLDESKDRIRSAFSSSNITLPRKKITINIAPSDLIKNGSHYDVAICLSILIADKQISNNLKMDEVIVLGELGLDGLIKPVRGLLGKLIAGKSSGFNKFIIPAKNIKQAKIVPEINLLGCNSLSELFRILSSGDQKYISTKEGADIDVDENQSNTSIDFSEVIGQATAKRALEIAAAGQHNVLLSGPPGVGKSMLAKALIGIMPPLTRNQIIEITHFHSLVGSSFGNVVYERPLRSPHHSTSDIALIGGGQRPKPGEVTLSHEGVLFLDELPEFKRSAIESLRQPLEDRHITVSRAQERVTYPANFTLIATKNPCPCGFFGSSKPCICTPLEIDRYNKKLSGPIMDRIDLHVVVDSIDHTSLLSKTQQAGELSKVVQSRVIRTIKTQQSRFRNDTTRNGSMSNKEIKKFAKLTDEAKELLDRAAQKLSLSARVYMKTVKIARTIADLEASDTIRPVHVTEALRYRPITTS